MLQFLGVIEKRTNEIIQMYNEVFQSKGKTVETKVQENINNNVLDKNEDNELFNEACKINK